jgi:hypothetical protein
MSSSPRGSPVVSGEPPERRRTTKKQTTFDTLRRRGTGASTGSAKIGKEKGPFQEHFSCYEGLTWEALKNYLECKWPGITLVERRVRVTLEGDGEITY